MRIAIIGAGIAGNTLAYHLHQEHDVTLFESNDYIGGHTHTHHIDFAEQTIAVDTGFIVFNDRTYPEFNALLDKLGVAWRDSTMSFSVRNEVTGLEYNGTSLNSLFAQRRNLFSPKFHRMIRDILRFNREALSLLDATDELALGDFLKQGQYSPQFIRDYIIPMGAAIWSTDAPQMMQFPARFFVRFFHHHGMLTIDNRPQWRTIVGGSSQYLHQLTKSFKDRIQLNSAVISIKRTTDKVWLKTKAHEASAFDYVFFACHSDQALGILGAEASPQEREILSAIPYQENTVYLHHDVNLMPSKRLAWAAWNYHVSAQESHKVQVTYNMNILQGLVTKDPLKAPLLVTLNHVANIDPSKVIKKLSYMHPLYTVAGAHAQTRHAEISGHHRTAFAGAYWRNGFHEDGVVSALKAIDHFKKEMQLA